MKTTIIPAIQGWTHITLMTDPEESATTWRAPVIAWAIEESEDGYVARPITPSAVKLMDLAPDEVQFIRDPDGGCHTPGVLPYDTERELVKAYAPEGLARRDVAEHEERMNWTPD